MKRRITLTLFAVLTAAFSHCIQAQVSAYSFSQSSGSYISITGGTLLGGTATDDERYVNPAAPAGGTVNTGVGFPIGFNFTYNGIVFDRIAINNNGWISLGQSSLNPSVDINSTSNYTTPLASTAANTPALLRNRIAGFGRDLQAQAASTLRIETVGTTPNQECVIQWENFKRYGTTGTGDNFSFQIRLHETSNIVEVVFGSLTFGTTASTGTAAPQFGLGGTLSSDFNNRTTTTDWTATTAGATNDATCNISSGVVYPASGTSFQWAPPPACSGTPTAGVTVASSNPVCSGTKINLSLNGNPSGTGLTYQWISSSDGISYSNIAGATSPTDSVTVAAATYFRCIVTCSNSGLSDTSAAVYVTLNAPSLCYCTPPATNCNASDEITNVTFAGINNNSLCGVNGYTFYNAPSATVMQGGTYPLSVTFTNGGTEYVAAWFDWDQSGTFDASEFTLLGSLPGGTLNTNIIVPLTAATGTTAMRVRVRYNTTLTAADACIGYTYGETEDYLVNVQTAVPCVDPPAAGSISGLTQGCFGTTVVLSLSGQTGSTTVQWEVSNDSINFTDITGATFASYTTPAISVVQYYRVRVTCTTSSYTLVHPVYVTSPMLCYCNLGLEGYCPTNSITNVSVSVSTLNNNSLCGGANGNGDYYTAFPDTGMATATLYRTVTYSCSVTLDAASIVSLWIDYDHSGTFDASEWTQIMTNATVGSALFTVPAGALLGQTGMRVRSRASGSPNGDIDACTQFFSGETEDYIITIAPAPTCTTPPVGGTIAGPSSGFTDSAYLFVLTGSTGDIQWQFSTVSASGPFINIPGASNDSVDLYTTTGGTYYLRAYLTSPGCPADSSNVLTLTVVKNGDDACNAIAINVGYNGPFNCVGSTVQVGEIHPPQTGFQTQTGWGDTVLHGTMWFKFIAPASGRISVRTPGFDTQIAIWETPTCAALTSAGATLIVANDDDPNYASVGAVLYSSFIDSAICLTPGLQYFLQIDAYSLADLDTTSIIITDLGAGPDATFNNLNASYCVSQPAVSLVPTVAGGTFNGTGVAGNTFNPSVAGVGGPYVITYTRWACYNTKDTVSVNAGLTVSAVPTSTSCNGGSDGSIDLTVSGGSSYAFTWSNSATSEDISGLIADTYSVSVTDISSCTGSASTTVSEPDAILISLDSTHHVSCNGGNDGGLYITVNGGTLSYTFGWSDASTSEDATGLGTGNSPYVVTVTDANSCTATSNPFTVTEPSVLSAAVDSVHNNECSYSLNGTVYITVTGGTAAFTYSWSSGATNEDVTGLGAGTVMCTVTDSKGCTATVTGSVTSAPVLSATVDSTHSATCNGVADGAVYASANGGTGSISFLWSNTAISDDIIGVAANNYTVTATDANGCTAAASGTVSEPTAINAVVDSTYEVNCFGESNGAIYTSTSGGNAPYLFAWNNNATTDDITGLSANTYTLTVTDNSGCTSTIQGNVTQPLSALSASSVSSDDMGGVGNGSIDLTADGGTPSYTYNWSNGATTEDISSLTAGIYTCTITDANGCTTVINDTVSLITGIAVVNGNFNLSLYPNPTNDVLFFDITLAAATNVAVQIFAADGKLVGALNEKNISTGKFTFSFAEQAEGVYTAKIVAGEFVVTKRIVVAR